MEKNAIEMRVEAPVQNGAPLMWYIEPLEPANDSNKQANKGLHEYWRLLGEHRLVLFLLAIAGAIGGLAIALHESPIYRARASLEVRSEATRTPLSGMEMEDRFSPESYLQTQIRILQSVTLRKRANQRLVKDFPERTYIVADQFSALRPYFSTRVPEPVMARTLPPVTLEIKTFGSSRIVEMLVETTDPGLAADYANTLAREYIDYTMESRWDTHRRTAKWLNEQLALQRVKLEESQQRLQVHSRNMGVFPTSVDGKEGEDEHLRRLMEELGRAQAERVAKQASYEIAAAAPADSVPQVADNDRLSGYLARLTEMRRELAELSAVWTPEHYRVIRVQAQINELENTIKRERSSILTRIRNDYLSAERREKMLGSAYEERARLVTANSGQMIQYSILKREVETNRTLYDELLQKVREVGIGSQMEQSTARLLDLADEPRSPTAPNHVVLALLGVLTGLFGGVLLIVLADHFNRSLHAPGQSPFYLNVPELGVIPSSNTAAGIFPRKETLSLTESETKGQDASVELVTWRDRPSMIAESFRSTLASILLTRGPEGRPKVILITSANAGEGKSTAVTNLGAALAEINHRVLVIDADLRQPHLHEILNVPNTWGLSDLLRESMAFADCPIEALARKTEISNLWILPAGPGTVSIANLLCSTRINELVERLRKDFDTVIIDTPPLLYLSDARLMGALADAAVLVIRSGRTTRDEAIAAKKRLVDDGIKVLGTILNDWNLKDAGRYGYRSYASPNGSRG